MEKVTTYQSAFLRNLRSRRHCQRSHHWPQLRLSVRLKLRELLLLVDEAIPPSLAVAVQLVDAVEEAGAAVAQGKDREHDRQGQGACAGALVFGHLITRVCVWVLNYHC